MKKMKLSAKLKTLLCTLFVLLSITNLQAASFTIVEISRDDNNLVYRLVIDSADESIIDQVRKETYQNKKLINNEVLNPKDLKKGIVLEEQKGFDVLVLRSANFDMVYGGAVEVDTLYSGVTGERRSTYFDLTKHENGWALFYRNRLVKALEIRVNKIPILGVVGIKELIIKY